MSKNLQQIQVSGGVVTPDKLFTDNILETRLKAAEEAKMLDKRLAAAEKEGVLSRDLTKTQYEAQNQLARDKLAADVADQTSRLALLKDQDARQAALHGMQLGEAGMKLDKLAKADAAEKAYVAAISNPETLRQNALKSTNEYKELESMQKGVDANMAEFKGYIEADLKQEQEQAAKEGKQLLTPDQFTQESQKRLAAAVAAGKSALPSVLNPETRNSEYTQGKIFEALKASADKQQLQDATRAMLAKSMGVAPTEEQINAVLGSAGVDYTAQQKAMDDKYSEQIKGITGILKESITPSVIRNISSKPSTSGLDIKDVTDSGIFTDGKKEFTNAVVGAKILAEQNPEAIPSKYLDAALSYAAYQGVKGADNEGKVKFSMSPEDLFIAAKEALPMVMNSEKSTGQQFSPQQALSMLNEMYSTSPNARATYGSRIANALYGDSGANLPKATSAPVTAANIGSTYDKYVNDSARLAEEKLLTPEMIDSADRLFMGEGASKVPESVKQRRLALTEQAQRAIDAGVDSTWVRNKLEQGDLGSLAAAADAGTSSRFLSGIYNVGNRISAIGKGAGISGGVLADMVLNGANFDQAVAGNKDLIASAMADWRKAGLQDDYADFNEQSATIEVDPYLQWRLANGMSAKEALKNTIEANRRLPQ